MACYVYRKIILRPLESSVVGSCDMVMTTVVVSDTVGDLDRESSGQP